MPVRAVKVIGQVRAALAALLPARAKHEVIDDQLAPAVEKTGERFFPSRSVENIFLVDPDHRQFAPRRTERVSLPG
jgi:hypothetical protein